DGHVTGVQTCALPISAPFVCVETPQELERVRLPFPVFVKPVAEGSGKGVFSNNLCDTPARLRERVRFLLERYAEPVLVETYLPRSEERRGGKEWRYER